MTLSFPLTPGDPLPPVWVALCGHRIGCAEFEALDPGTGKPCRDCHQRWAAPHQQHTSLPVRSPGQHMHPGLRRAPSAGRGRGTGGPSGPVARVGCAVTGT
ncbi:MAG: hypothetical protein M3460_01730 [Actinomycetota bacterium]|nr:hypothetical protein [Actinomycetota bacterium]